MSIYHCSIKVVSRAGGRSAVASAAYRAGEKLYNEETGLVDLYDGMGDIQRRVIRCVGNPDERFDEDALRIMRAVRFAAELDFDIDEATRKAAADHAPELAAV